MTCVIVNHSKLSSMLSWFSYERFWIVTAAEVFVVLSGVVLGMVYGRRLARDGWRAVARGLGRRAMLLYASFVGVTLSVPLLARLGVDIAPITGWDTEARSYLLATQGLNAAAWRDVLLMRAGPWTFQIVGLYVVLVAAAVPCLLVLHRVGWRPLLVTSWALYGWYRFHPHAVTPAGFEATFPLLVWQLLFVHGIAIGYHRDRIAASIAGTSRIVLPVAAVATAGFVVFAFSNPWTDGPAWLQLHVISADRFSELYERYFSLSALGVGRLLNLAVALPVGYAMLTRFWPLARHLEPLFVTLGQRSLGAFVLHVYGVLFLANANLPESSLGHAVAQLAIVCGIAALLNLSNLVRDRRRAPARAQPLAA
jgi:hypothetical protein